MDERKLRGSNLKCGVKYAKRGQRVEQNMIPDAATFWSACSTCRLLHQFEKRYIARDLVCPGCSNSFNHSETRDDGNVVRVTRSRGNLSSTLNSASFHTKKLTSISQSQLHSISSDDDEIGSRRRLRSGSTRIRNNNITPPAHSNLNPSVKMEEEMITLAELQSQVLHKARKQKEEEAAGERESKRNKKALEDDGEGLTLKEMKGLLRMRRQGASKKTRPLQNSKPRNLKNDVNRDLKKQGPFCNGDDLDMMKVEDSDFYDFDKDRMEPSFKKGQVWTIYDDDDGMPRHYGLIEQVAVNPFEVKMSWLDIQNNEDAGLLSWEKMGFHVSCGSFKVSKKTTIHSLNIFSHVVDCERAAREVYRIYPKKGSVWALYKEEEALNTEKRNGSQRTYDIAVFLTTYNEMHGLSMAYLEKVDGYKTIFKRREIGYHAIRWFGKDDIRLFSHQIPARKLSVDEALGHLKDCWELDPASLSSDLLITTCGRR